MIEFLSSWTKGLGVTIVVVSILEMLLPNNKTKKYIRMVLGVFVIFNIISPLIQNKDKLDLSNLDIEDYTTVQTTSTVTQTSMDERINKLYEEELEKDITKKVEEKGYNVKSAKINTTRNDEQEWEINQIQLNIEKGKEPEKETETVENKIVTEVQKIKKIDTKINKEEKTSNQEKRITNTDIQNVKKVRDELIEIYCFPEALAAKVDTILYSKLMEYDKNNKRKEYYLYFVFVLNQTPY